MPLVSQAQRGLFHLCKVAPERARQKCPPRKVIDKFIAEDKGGRLRKLAPKGR